MKYAILKTGGKQYRVEKGSILEVEHLAAKGSTVVFDEVLLVSDGDKVIVGTPSVKGASIKAKIIESDLKGEKIVGMRFKAKSRYRRRFGHRQHLTKVQITDIIS